MAAKRVIKRKQPKPKRSRGGRPQTTLVGQTAVASWINTKHQFKCDSRSISFWQRGQRLPSGGTEFFPPPFQANRYKIVAVDEWCRRNLKAGGEQELFAKDRKDLAEARIKEVEARNAERQESDLYCETATAENFITAAYIQDCHLVDKLIEDRDGVRRLVQEQGAGMGLTPQQLTELDARLVPALKAMNDHLKDQFQNGTAAVVGRAVDAKKQE